jgi:hypothetical protein
VRRASASNAKNYSGQLLKAIGRVDGLLLVVTSDKEVHKLMLVRKLGKAELNDSSCE